MQPSHKTVSFAVLNTSNTEICTYKPAHVKLAVVTFNEGIIQQVTDTKIGKPITYTV